MYEQPHWHRDRFLRGGLEIENRQFSAVAASVSRESSLHFVGEIGDGAF